ncbi:MAG: DUF1203 domain-containing protein [Devosiaceae bacterium]|nr:DUF1203 domain-containing protein [Devosiaceae bacterium MH13]
MDFQIQALAPDPFAPLFEMDDAQLAARNARKMTVTAKPGTPCRVSLCDAEVGETVVLVHHTHQPAKSPYHASHAIFVRENAEQAKPSVNEVPQVLRTRLISVRLFDEDAMMIGADVVPGEMLGTVLQAAFEDESVAYIHLHNAKPGCFAASVSRASKPDAP